VERTSTVIKKEADRIMDHSPKFEALRNSLISDGRECDKTVQHPSAQIETPERSAARGPSTSPAPKLHFDSSERADRRHRDVVYEIGSETRDRAGEILRLLEKERVRAARGDALSRRNRMSPRRRSSEQKA
jgi:hypothetical protein